MVSQEAAHSAVFHLQDVYLPEGALIFLLIHYTQSSLFPFILLSVYRFLGGFTEIDKLL